MAAKTRIATWGSSLAIRIPKPIAEQWGVREGSAVEIAHEGDTLVLRKRAYDLDHLVSGIILANIHSEHDTGAAQGNEIW